LYTTNKSTHLGPPASPTVAGPHPTSCPNCGERKMLRFEITITFWEKSNSRKYCILTYFCLVQKNCTQAFCPYPNHRHHPSSPTTLDPPDSHSCCSCLFPWLPLWQDASELRYQQDPLPIRICATNSPSQLHSPCLLWGHRRLELKLYPHGYLMNLPSVIL
jgi:hypothetical protein